MVHTSSDYQFTHLSFQYFIISIMLWTPHFGFNCQLPLSEIGLTNNSKRTRLKSFYVSPSPFETPSILSYVSLSYPSSTVATELIFEIQYFYFRQFTTERIQHSNPQLCSPTGFFAIETSNHNKIFKIFR